jgi:ectoine hydroxylase-related dioxygenase (phytanoyl-CoA dioxygenase family)
MWFFKKQKITEVKRDFSKPYFRDNHFQQSFEKYGYVVLKDIITDEEINEALAIFHALQQMDAYKVDSRFESAGNFICKETQAFIFDFIREYSKKIAPRFANLDNCDIGEGGTFFIKPPGDESILHPHQDSTVIDEATSYGIFIWIPLQDITMNNGPLYILPHSHLWGNVYRSQHIPWAFRKQYKYLWEKMQPVPVKKGDIICFDTSIIHASGINKTNQIRVAACGALLPKNHEKVEYLLKDQLVYQYKIDNEYWLDGGQETTLNKYTFTTTNYNYPNPVNKSCINQLLNKYT